MIFHENLISQQVLLPPGRGLHLYAQSGAAAEEARA